MMIEKISKEIKSGRGGARDGAGRPAGKPNKLTRPVKELAASYGPASIARLVQLRDKAESEQVRFAAAKELLDRAYGRPRQEIDLGHDTSIAVIVQRINPQPHVIDVRPGYPIVQTMSSRRSMFGQNLAPKGLLMFIRGIVSLILILLTVLPLPDPAHAATPTHDASTSTGNKAKESPSAFSHTAGTLTNGIAIIHVTYRKG